MDPDAGAPSPGQGMAGSFDHTFYYIELRSNYLKWRTHDQAIAQISQEDAPSGAGSNGPRRGRRGARPGRLQSSSSSSTTSSSGTSSSTATSAAPRSRRPSARPSTSGTIIWSASPITSQWQRHPAGADQRLREAVPEHPRHPGVRADEHRHQPGHAGHGDLGRLGHPGRLHGRRDLARPVRRAPARRAAVGLPADELLRAVRARPGRGRQLQGQGLRLAAVRGPGLHVLPQGPAGQGGPDAADDLGAAGKRGQDPGEQGPGQVRLRLAGRLV